MIAHHHHQQRQKHEQNYVQTAAAHEQQWRSARGWRAAVTRLHHRPAHNPVRRFPHARMLAKARIIGMTFSKVLGGHHACISWFAPAGRSTPASQVVGVMCSSPQHHELCCFGRDARHSAACSVQRAACRHRASLRIGVPCKAWHQQQNPSRQNQPVVPLPVQLSSRPARAAAAALLHGPPPSHPVPVRASSGADTATANQCHQRLAAYELFGALAASSRPCPRDRPLPCSSERAACARCYLGADTVLHYARLACGRPAQLPHASPAHHRATCHTRRPAEALLHHRGTTRHQQLGIPSLGSGAAAQINSGTCCHPYGRPGACSPAPHQPHHGQPASAGSSPCTRPRYLASLDKHQPPNAPITQSPSPTPASAAPPADECSLPRARQRRVLQRQRCATRARHQQLGQVLLHGGAAGQQVV
jgi:hypothetical protein